jgi:phosphomethylpyrimidine synthase
MPSSVKKDEVDLSAFPGSRKVYVEGSRPDIQVPMREISLSKTSGIAGEEENAPLRVYDTSGAYTDTEAYTDIRQGLQPHRLCWIAGRGDSEGYEGRAVKVTSASFKSSGRQKCQPAALCAQGYRHGGDGIYRNPRKCDT